MNQQLDEKVVRSIFLKETPCPDFAEQIFSGRKKHLLEAFAKGFRIGDEDSSNVNEFTPKEFNKYYTDVMSCRVWTKSAHKVRIGKLIDDLGAEKYPSHAQHQLLRWAREVYKDLPDTKCEFFMPKQYESFYGKNVEHEVDMVNDIFFLQYPKAKPRSK